MLEHRALTEFPRRPKSAPLRVTWPAGARLPARAPPLDLRGGGRRLAVAARLGLAGAALLAAPGLRFRFVPRWWPSFMRAARAAGPRAVIWTIIWSGFRAGAWVAAGFARKWPI